jgi:anthranilate synthase component 2
MLLLIDNYDSFTYNLWHYFGEMGVEVEVARNDAITAAEAMARRPEAIIISPGPCDPDKAGICLDLIKEATGKIPLFGVCLGFQAIGQTFGIPVVRAPQPMHGKLSVMKHTGTGIFKGIPNPFKATRYHSLMLERIADWPSDIEITCETEDGIVMGIQHRKYPIAAVLFHPESIASEHGHTMIGNFLDMANCKRRKAA